jgi:hypothetical protein
MFTCNLISPLETRDTPLLKEERLLLRDLAKRYLDICHDPDQERRRDLWRRFHSLQPTPPPIYVRAFAWREMPESKLVCTDPVYRRYENFFKQALFQAGLKDDFVFEPWVTVPAVYTCTGWGISGKRHYSDEPRGSWKLDYPIKELSDIEKLRKPWHGINAEATAKATQYVQDVIGDIITVNIDRAPAYRMWTHDISTDLGYLRGIENLMFDMIDNPEWLHRLLAFMRDGILEVHAQAEAAGDWGLTAHHNQAMPYAEELPDPAPNVNGVMRKQLWGYMAAQEYTLISPAMHDEFLLQYQIPILSRFGLAAYGCCEDLTRKIDILRQIPNLRRISVSPFADVAACAEQIGTDYCISYRPSPTDMVSTGFDVERITKTLQRDFAYLKGCYFDITLKDVETVESDPNRVRRWVQLVRRLLEDN